MFKRVLIIVSILFVAMSVVGCAGGGGKQSVAKVEEFHDLVLEDVGKFYIAGRFGPVNYNLSKDDVDKYMEFAKKLVSKSKKVDKFEILQYASDITDSIAITDKTADIYKTHTTMSILKIKGDIFMVSFSFDGDEKDYTYKITGAAKYNADFEQLFKDILPDEE